MGATDWLATDLDLAAADADQLRRHLGWLVEDLRARAPLLAGQAPDLAALADQITDCLDRLAHLDALLGRVRRAVA